MVGRTNAMLQPLVSSVNGMTGTVVITPNDISFDPSGTYNAGTVGKYLKDASTIITHADIDSLYT